MKKIIIIGCCGSGKSTFARRLRDELGLPLHYLDMIWHKPDKTNVTIDEFDAELKKILCNDKWIIDGNYQRTLEMRMERCDTIFLLDFPLDICISNARNRIGKTREDMPWIEKEFDDDFKQWIIDFHKTQLPQIYSLFEKYKHKKIIIFKNRNEIEEFFRNKGYK